MLLLLSAEFIGGCEEISDASEIVFLVGAAG